MATSNSLITKVRRSEIVQETAFLHSPKINNITINIPCDKKLILNKMNEMRIHKELCDIKLISGNGHEIWAHKIVLAARSEYFHIMFTSGFKEIAETEVFMQDINPHVLSLLIDFIYTYELVVDVQNAVEILNGICLLQLDEMACDLCVEFIKANIDHSNCLGLIELGESLLLYDLHSYCWKYALNHYKDITVTEEFLRISFDLILQIIKSDDLCVEEEIVFNSLMKWIKHDTENRKKHMSDLFEFVRLPLVSSSFLQTSVDTEEIVKSNQDCKKYVNEAFIVQSLNGTGFEETSSIRSQYRPKFSKCVLIMNRNGRRHFPILYNVISNEFKSLPISVPKVPGGLILILNDGRIMEIGGYEFYEGVQSPEDRNEFEWDLEAFYRSNRLVNIVEINVKSATIYNFEENQWTSIDQMIYGHSNGACVQIENRVFLIRPNVEENQYYNITINKWFRISPSSIRRYHYRIIALDDFIYVVGGRNHYNATPAVEQYNTKSDTWKTVASMHYARYCLAICVLDNNIYAIGGSTLKEKYVNTVERYNPVDNVWIEVAPLNIKRTKAGAVSLNGVLYVFGGTNSGYSIEVYCPYKNKWTVMTQTIPNAFGDDCMCQVFVIPQTIQNLYLDISK